MADKETKAILERVYVVPLRSGWINTPYYRRVKRAVKILKEFIAKHMKVENRDSRKVKLDMYVNNEIGFRNESPPNKLKVKATKMDNGDVRVELVDIPDVIKYKMARTARLKDEAEKRVAEKPKEEKVEEKKQTEEDKAKEVEKEKAVEIAEEVRDKAKKKEMKHEVTFPKQKNQVRTANQSSDKN